MSGRDIRRLLASARPGPDSRRGHAMGSPGMEPWHHREPTTILFTRAAAAGVCAALIRRARRRLSQAVSPSRPGMMTMPATLMTRASAVAMTSSQVLKFSWPRQSMMCSPHRKS